MACPPVCVAVGFDRVSDVSQACAPSTRASASLSGGQHDRTRPTAYLVDKREAHLAAIDRDLVAPFDGERRRQRANNTAALITSGVAAAELAGFYSRAKTASFPVSALPGKPVCVRIAAGKGGGAVASARRGTGDIARVPAHDVCDAASAEISGAAAARRCR